MKNVKEIELKIEKEKWTKLLDKAFKKKVKDTNIDGFRKGACPKDVFIKKFGIESLFMDAADFGLDDAYHKVIEDNNLKPVVPGKVDITKIDENGVTYKFTIIEKPEVKLGKYTKLGVKKEKVEVTDEELEKEIENLRSRYADIVEEESGVASLGETAVINFEGYVDGEKLEGGSGENYPLELGSNTFIPGFEDGVVGMNVGDEKELNLKFPEDYVENLKGKKVLFKVKLVKIRKKVLPELNEEFFKDCGHEHVKDVNEFKEDIKNHLLEHKEEHANNEYMNALMKEAIKNLEVEINEEIIDQEVENMINNYREELRMQGLTLEKYFEFTKGNLEDFKKNLVPQATDMVKSRYLLEAIIEKENIEVSDEDVNAEIKKIVDMYGITEEQFLEQVGSKDPVIYDLKMRKAMDELKK